MSVGFQSCAPGCEQPCEQFTQRLDKLEQFWAQDVAFAHIDNAVGQFGIESLTNALLTGTFRALSAALRRLAGGDRCGCRIVVSSPCCASAVSIRELR